METWTQTLEQDDLQATDPAAKNRPAPWWTLDQLLGPLEGLWNAGHVSVTRRNRRELCVLETAYQGKLFIHHVVFSIPQQLDDNGNAKPAPLSWKLTAGQLAYISSVANGDRLAAADQNVKAAMGKTNSAVTDAMNWVETAEKPDLPSPEVCRVSNGP